jgi:hypothetical protein
MLILLDMLSELHGLKTGVITAVIARRKLLAENNSDFVLADVDAIVGDHIDA